MVKLLHFEIKDIFELKQNPKLKNYTGNFETYKLNEN